VTLYLYALAEGLADVDGLMGVAGSAIVVFDVGGARVVAGWTDALPAVTRETLEAQDRLVRALHRRARALLPFRFGTAARDIDAARRSIEILHPDLANRLALVRDRDQMTVRVLPADPQGTTIALPVSQGDQMSGLDAGPGARYLRARAAAHAQPPALVALFDPVSTVARATVFEAGRHTDLVGTVYQLIDRGADRDYQARLQAAAATRPFALRISGPSPAYAFAMR
jgi:hypothetical protein